MRSICLAVFRGGPPVCCRRPAGTGVWTFSGLKARDMTAWGEAQRAKPQVRVRKENPLRAESAGHRVEMIPVFCFGLSGLGGILGHQLPGPPLATLAPAQAVISRAFSPPFRVEPVGNHRLYPEETGWKPVPRWLPARLLLRRVLRRQHPDQERFHPPVGPTRHPPGCADA